MKSSVVAICFVVWLFVILRFPLYEMSDGGFAIILRAATSLAGCIAVCGLCTVVYDHRKIYEYQMHWDYDEDIMVPEHYEIVRFLKRKVFCCLNIQGLSYWNFRNLLLKSEGMTGKELADELKEILARRN